MILGALVLRIPRADIAAMASAPGAAPWARRDWATVVSPSCSATARSVPAGHRHVVGDGAARGPGRRGACWSLIAAMASGGSADAGRVAVTRSASAASLRAHTATVTSRQENPASSAARR